MKLVVCWLQFYGSNQSPTLFYIAMESRSRHTIDRSFWWRSVTFSAGQNLVSQPSSLHICEFIVLITRNLQTVCGVLRSGIYGIQFLLSRSLLDILKVLTLPQSKSTLYLVCLVVCACYRQYLHVLLKMLTAGHLFAGVLAMAWCPCDSSLLLTCSKDNQTLCWDTGSGEVSDKIHKSQFHLGLVVHNFMWIQLWGLFMWWGHWGRSVGLHVSWYVMILQEEHFRTLHYEMRFRLFNEHSLCIGRFFVKFPLGTIGTLMFNGRLELQEFCQPHHMMEKLVSTTLR